MAFDHSCTSLFDITPSIELEIIPCEIRESTCDFDLFNINNNNNNNNNNRSITDQLVITDSAASAASCCFLAPAVSSGSIVATTLDSGPGGSWFESRVGANILWGYIDRLHRAYPSLHPFGVVHWVPVLSNIKTATGCESNRQLQPWTVFAGTVVFIRLSDNFVINSTAFKDGLGSYVK